MCGDCTFAGAFGGMCPHCPCGCPEPSHSCPGCGHYVAKAPPHAPCVPEEYRPKKADGLGRGREDVCYRCGKHADQVAREGHNFYGGDTCGPCMFRPGLDRYRLRDLGPDELVVEWKRLHPESSA